MAPLLPNLPGMNRINGNCWRAVEIDVNRNNRVGAALAGWILAVLLGGLTNAQAEANALLKTTYEVNVGGITVLDIKYRLEMSPAGYQSRAEIETRGVAIFFSDYQMKMKVSGSFGDGQATPAEYTSRRKKKDKTKEITLNWSSNGRPSTSGGRFSKQIEAALTPASVDPLTAVFRAGTVSKGTPCQTTQRIYDGREVFDLRFTFVQEVKAGDSWPGAYRGAAYECRLTYEPVAGKNAEKFREANEPPATYTVWLAPVAMAGGSLLIPVRATGILDGLRFMAYTSRAEIGGRPFNQHSATGD